MSLAHKIMTDNVCLNTNPVESWEGQLQLLVLQPSPFCNLNCDYCYLPDRQNTRRMAFKTLDLAAKKIFTAKLPTQELSVIWHAGEPLAVPRDWYRQAFSILASHCPQSVKLTHHFQTNGVLIDEKWGSFFREFGVRVGVSLDGPAWLHDRHRKTRDFKGTHARVLNGISVLTKLEIPFHVICVLTRESLEYPDEIYDFFADLDILQLCFNIEEIEAANKLSSLAVNPLDTEKAYRLFMAQILKRSKSAKSVNSESDSSTSGKYKTDVVINANMRIRELDDVIKALRYPGFANLKGNSQNLPGKILSIAWDGHFSTFSPELLGQSTLDYGDLVIGNINSDDIPPQHERTNYARQREAIRAGVEKCKATCSYFDLCLGGAPSNKLGETGRFDTSETLYCKLTKQAVIDVVLEELDHALPDLTVLS
jgi:uncharacterized protein